MKPGTGGMKNATDNSFNFNGIDKCGALHNGSTNVDYGKHLLGAGCGLLGEEGGEER